MALQRREIGARIQELRSSYRPSLTQADLAEKMDVTMRTVQNWEAGKTIKPAHLERLAALFGVPERYIEFGEIEPVATITPTRLLSNNTPGVGSLLMDLEQIRAGQQRVLTRLEELTAAIEALTELERAAGDLADDDDRDG